VELIWVFGCFALFFVMQKKMDQMVDLIKRLKLCVRWCVDENDKLHSEVESAVKNCCDTGIFLFIFFIFLLLSFVVNG
jgi:hypothetical protein